MIKFKNENEVPVLILSFNRLGGMQDTFNILREIKVKYIYLASDGARSESESFDVDAIRSKVESFIDWPCEVKTLFQKENLGCKRAVHTAVQWFFSEVDAGIVLEDDCVPNKRFFSYCRNMLNNYRSDLRVATISGRKHFDLDMHQDYSFCSRFFCWGWASWSDRILGLDVELPYKSNFKLLNTPSGIVERLYVQGVLGLLSSRQVNSWAYSYEMLFRNKHQYCIIPNGNLIRNVGFGTDGTHSNTWTHDPMVYEEAISIAFNPAYDPVEYDKYLHTGLLSEYRGRVGLLVFSQIKYLKTIRLLVKRLIRRG